MKTLFAAALAAGTLAAATPAAAATSVSTFTPMKFTIDMKNSGLGTPSSAIGNSFTYQATASNGEKLDVMVTAWSREYKGPNSPLNDTIKRATLRSWGNDGLGIYQDGEKDAGNLHQIDNVNGWEFVTLQFSRAVTLTGGVLNAFTLADFNTKDNDAFIGWGNSTAAWNSNLNLQNYRWDDVSRGLMGSGNTNSDGTAAQTFSLTNAAANTWMIGGSMGGPDDWHDAFKLAQVTVTAVPEPATWAMMLVGFAMVGAAARYRRRRSVVRFA